MNDAHSNKSSYRMIMVTVCSITIWKVILTNFLFGMVDLDALRKDLEELGQVHGSYEVFHIGYQEGHNVSDGAILWLLAMPSPPWKRITMSLHSAEITNIFTLTHNTVVAKKHKTTLLVKLLIKSFYVFWPPLYIREIFFSRIFFKEIRNHFLHSAQCGNYKIFRSHFFRKRAIWWNIFSVRVFSYFQTVLWEGHSV